MYCRKAVCGAEEYFRQRKAAVYRADNKACGSGGNSIVIIVDFIFIFGVNSCRKNKDMI